MERFAAAGQAEDAIAAVAAGAQVASFLHPGVFASERMEAALRAIATEHLVPLPERDRPADPRRILHVATETYGIGGHTRAIMRWIGRDAGREHSVVTTAQRADVPQALIETIGSAGGTMRALHPDAPWLDRAQALRALSSDFDMVVLHCHHRDPVPVLAFSAAGGRPPVVTFNHADHQFWLGYSVTDVLHCVRDIPAHTMRGIPAGRIAMTPLPVFGGHDDHTSREPLAAEERARARGRLLPSLGWPADAVVLLTVGNQIKYTGPEGARLQDLVEPVLEQAPQARLLAIGTAGIPEFDAFAERHAGRVVSLDRVAGLEPAFRSADVYLESRPGGGGTVTAEAAAHGLPCLSEAPTPIERNVLCTEPKYGNRIASSPAEYTAALLALVADPAERARAGAEARTTLHATDAAWEEGVERVYALAAARGPVAPADLATPVEDGDPIHLLIDFFQETTALYHPPADSEGAIAALELAAAAPELRSLFQTLCGLDCLPRLDRQFVTAFAAPPPEPAALRAVIGEFRRLAQVRAAEGFVIALAPGDADSAVPVLEEELAAGPDVDVDLVLADDPSGARPEWSLAVVGSPAESAGVAAPVLVSGALD